MTILCWVQTAQLWYNSLVTGHSCSPVGALSAQRGAHKLCLPTLPCMFQDLLPPKDPEVQVRALQDYGEMVASDGTIHFQRNAVFFMAQEDAEPLIRQGVLERMDMADLH